jgi:hypothetical protein
MTDLVYIRRQWSDAGRIGWVRAGQIQGLHWDCQSGGYGREGGFGNGAPFPFLHGYVWCNDIEGEIGHSCMHGPPPHRIKVCIVQKDNPRSVYKSLLDRMSPSEAG